jgi:hypothetical protein
MLSDQALARYPKRERRKYLRKLVFVPVELCVEGGTPVIRTNATNLNVGGCFLKMIFSLEPGTKIALAMTLPAACVNVAGIVVSRSRSLGNGIKFTEIAPEHRFKLEQFIGLGPFKESAGLPS